MRHLEVKLWFLHELPKLEQLNFPHDWKEAFTNFLTLKNLKSYPMQRDERNWQIIESKLKHSFGGLPQAIILKIEVIQNIHLWGKFQKEIEYLKQKLKTDDLKTELLWHGTSTTDPQ